MAGYWRYYGPKSKPRQTDGGIKARSKRGSFASSWWGRRWEEVIEGFPIGARLSRGRGYARQGQVLSIEIEKGLIKSEVQGSRSRPYRVTVGIKPISPTGWKKLIKVLSEKAGFAARLLAGRMPEELEQVFLENDLPLFPQSESDLIAECSCPDWSIPCKHAAATLYLVCEEFDRDPFLLLRLRGLDREELLEALNISQPSEDYPHIEEDPEKTDLAPLPPDPGLFWGGESKVQAEPPDFRIPTGAAALIRRLGPFPFWRGKKDLHTRLQDVYTNVSGEMELRVIPPDDPE